MTTVTIGVSGIAETRARLEAAFRGEPQGAHISFPSVELLWTVLTPQRWTLLHHLVGAESLRLSDLAGLSDRTIDEVEADVAALVKAGLVDRMPGGGICVPFDAVHVDFTLGRAA